MENITRPAPDVGIALGCGELAKSAALAALPLSLVAIVSGILGHTESVCTSARSHSSERKRVGIPPIGCVVLELPTVHEARCGRQHALAVPDRGRGRFSSLNDAALQ